MRDYGRDMSRPYEYVYTTTSTRAGRHGSLPLHKNRTRRLCGGWSRLNARLGAGHVPPLQIRLHHHIHPDGQAWEPAPCKRTKRNAGRPYGW